MNNDSASKNLLISEIKVTEITPDSMHCGVGACPAIYETDQASFIIIGSRLNAQHVKQLFPAKLGLGEVAIEVPKELLSILLA